MKIVIINGPNLNFLGIREPDIYGTQTLEDIETNIQKYAETQEVSCTFFQSNSEGEIIDRIQQAYQEKVDGIVINPAAYTHYSYAIHDAVKAVSIPTIEVHLSAIHARESFRKESVIAPACMGQISGFGETGYLLAIQALKENLS
ncbi:type II 3-dehydroquinate dehydratase [Jeotgalibaca sp. MA1X17-3]|uniref:type II 3-dehydroquinate dehydratase n=1 Tax=Jeotgalibaca sp. MA1X17-3 TaxID=2908211 RepID=UPI001F195A0B|nr:type II 3-dehydroquinate dehydratase [Jeotgalibaca sp. MA1X17-3]UJF16035.1 type II 3-dehydroquinate dehydratase [Jeotgalibaca sp. MA1X17-3]